jgi:glycosyltransferase involved in cell wall biosynthesis
MGSRGEEPAEVTGTRIDDTSSSNGHARLADRTWPGLAADLDGSRLDSGPTRPARVAIASYEFNGIVRNGGIGTACTSLARALAAEGHQVDLFFTGWAEDPSSEGFDRWERHYARIGARLHWLDVGALASRYDAPLFSAAHSLALYEQLRARDEEQPYDVIHFVESIGHGFYSLLAKRQGLAFQRATAVVGVHSPRRWMAEAHGLPFDGPDDLGDEQLERRSVELADVVVSPSAHMLDWLQRRGVRLPERSYVQQYVTDFDREAIARPAPRARDATAVEELVFFGRLEQRKGLPVFCDALDELFERPTGSLERVTFLGRQVPIDGAMSGDYIAARAERWPWECRVISDLDRDAALDYLRRPGRQAVMASPIDNSPNTVYEAIGLGIAFLASRGGGIAELVHPADREDFTYEPCDPDGWEIDPGDPRALRPRHTGRVLAERLERALAQTPRRARYAVDPKANREAHLRWHRAAARGGAPGGRAAAPLPAPAGAEAASPDRDGGPPVVTVDVRDLGRAPLPPDREDGFVLVLDAGVERDPELVAALLAAAARSPGVGFFTSLGSFDVETPDGPVRRCFLPTGGPPAFGVAANCFGAGAFLARRAALERTGVAGSVGAGSSSATVGGVLARVALAREQIDVVPRVLYHLPPTAAHWDSLGSWADPFEALQPYHLAFSPEAADVAGIAWRLARDRHYLRERTEQAEQVADETARRLATIVASRSWRWTGLLRRPAARLKRIARGSRS